MAESTGRLQKEHRFKVVTCFKIVTYGCQMNVHDTEKLSNLLLHAGLQETDDAAAADLLVINTCSIRDKAENQLYSDLGKLRDWKEARAGRALGVGGCVAQQVGDRLLKRFSHVDFVFGTHNLRLVPTMLDSALAGERSARTEESRSLERFDLPQRHADYESGRSGRAFVTVMEGCDRFCSFCIVPMTRGREISRPADAIVDEVRTLAGHGIREVTLLGQTVNAYGRHDLRRGHSEAHGTVAFGELLRRLDGIPGIERIRYTSPHPLFFDDALVGAHAELEHLCPHVHLPLQSGSSAVLERMRRGYTRDEYLAITARLRASRPDIAITGDVIVGFPGETQEDFEETLSAMREAGFVDSYSFKYSARPGTSALELDGEVPPEEARARLAVLQQVQRELTLDHHRSRVGTRTRILVEGLSQKATQKAAQGIAQVRGRDPWHRLVNVPGSAVAGRFLDVEIVEATPHSLIGTSLREQRGDEVPAAGDFSPDTVKSGARLAEEKGRSAGPAASGDPLRVL
jgi:tRNA-2-methylthio-N6-dimethylallyladenosine synthase